jgi:hypothetical protein
MSFLNSVMKSVRTRLFLAMSSALVMVAGMLFGANIATADSVWVQSYERTSQTAACGARPGETTWQASWGTDSSWSPSWEQWANNGNGGWVCTRSITWARTPEDAGSSTVTYALGDIGPGGGLVFYDAGSVQPWGRYLEMAPKTWSGGSGDPTDDWCSDVTNSVATGTAVGTGSANTTAMLTSASPFVACTASAANAVRAYPGDWFLPSKDELNAMCNYSRNPTTPPTGACAGSQSGTFASGLYGFAYEVYWSSSEDSSGVAWGQSFFDTVPLNMGKNLPQRVRPIRAF